MVQKIVPKTGDKIVMNDWLNERITIVVVRLSISPEYGDVVEGRDDNGKYRALPLSRKIETARVHTEGHGKWIIKMPDGTIERAKSKRAAQEFCDKHDIVMQEVLRGDD